MHGQGVFAEHPAQILEMLLVNAHSERSSALFEYRGLVAGDVAEPIRQNPRPTPAIGPADEHIGGSALPKRGWSRPSTASRPRSHEPCGAGAARGPSGMEL